MYNLLINVKLKVQEELHRIARLRRYLNSLNEQDDIAQYGLQRIIHYSPDSIKDGWSVEMTNDSIVFTHDRVSQTILNYLEYGTVAHYVAPVSKEVLHWVEDGEHFFSKGHMVSGIRAHLFYTRARSDMEDYAESRYGRNVVVTI